MIVNKTRKQIEDALNWWSAMPDVVPFDIYYILD